MAAAREPAVEGLTWLGGDRLGAWASPWDAADAEPTRERLLEHHELVARVHAATDCLPVRFPTLVADAAPLDARRAELLRALERVRGKTELALTLVWEEGVRPHPGPLPAGEGARYLEQRRRYWGERVRREAQAAALEEEFRAALGLPAEDVLAKTIPNDRVALSLAALVPRADAPRFAELLSRPRPGLRVMVNGPWPPYSFATVA